MNVFTYLFFVFLGFVGSIQAQTHVTQPLCVILPRGYIVQTVLCTDNRPNCGNPTPIPYGKPDKEAFLTIKKGTSVTLTTKGLSQVCVLTEDVYPIIQWVGGTDTPYAAFKLDNGQEVRTSSGKMWLVSVTAK